MSLTDVRQYFRDRAEAKNFKEHTDGFNIENIPNVSIDRTFHITSNTITPNAPIAHRTLDTSSDVTLRLLFKGFRDPAEAIDESISEGQDLLCEVLSSANRLGTSIKNVNFISMIPTPIAASNDNIVLLIMEFTARNILVI